MGEVVIRAESYGVEPTQLRAKIQNFDRSERVVRALKLAVPWIWVRREQNARLQLLARCRLIAVQL